MCRVVETEIRNGALVSIQQQEMHCTAQLSDILVLLYTDRALALMIHAIFLLLRQIPFSAMLLSHSKKGPSEHPAFPLLWATKSLSLRRSGVIFLFICHLTLFPVFLQACPFVTRCVWVMHHTGRCQTLPSGPLLHWSALREPRIHLDLLTCFGAYVGSIYLYILSYILYLSIHGRVCVCICGCRMQRSCVHLCVYFA